MGARGPSRTPTAILAARGSPLAKAREKTEPKPAAGAPSMPDFVRRDPCARAKWKEVVSTLPPGVLTKADRSVLTMFVQTWAIWREAMRSVQADGIALEGKSREGHARHFPNPAVKTATELLGKLVTLGSKLGLSPADRARLEVGETGGGESDAERMLRSLA